MVAAHTLGMLFARFRQPRVIGEIAAGLVLGPTLLGHIAPGAESRLFPATGVTPTVLGAVYQLGLLLLLFCSGAQIRSAHRRRENKTVGWVFGPGTAADMTYHVVATLAVLGAALAFGPRIYRAAAGWRLNLIRQASPVAYDLAIMLAATLLCLFLGIEVFFGAFVAGVAVGRAT